MPKHLVKTAAILVFGAVVVISAGLVRAQSLPPVEIMAAERVLGQKDAPLTLIEYASMTCPHCAAFHNGPYKMIKKDYIETGKLKMIFRDFPLDNVALAASMMARCAPKERYFGVVEIIFGSQNSWMRASDPRQALGNLARFAQISAETFNACMATKEVQDAVLKQRQEGVDKFKVSSTPTVMLNGVKIDSGLSDDDMRKVLDAALAKAKK